MKIIYASLARDYKHRDVLTEVIFDTTGFYSNESQENYSAGFMKEHGIANKIAVFPWEVLREEMDECNRVEMPIETTLIS